jgi:hypothetical protein
MPIDYFRANCRLRYGVAGIRVWLLQLLPTYRSIKLFYKNHAYLIALRKDRIARFAKMAENRKDPTYTPIKRKYIGTVTPYIEKGVKIKYL